MLTQEEIAQKVGLSRMTVYRYLTGQTVSRKTKETLDSFLKESSYRPNLTARSLVSRKTNLIGLLVPSVHYSYYPHIIQTIQSELRMNGYNVILSVSNDNTVEEWDEINLMLSIPVDGLIVSPVSSVESERSIQLLKENNIPFVLVDRRMEKIKCPFVGTDARKYSKLIVNYLVENGHRRIAHIGGPEENSFSADMYSGYIDAMTENNLTVDQRHVLRGDISEDTGRTSMKLLCQMKDGPTAIQAVNDTVALGALRYASENDVRVPESVSLVGFSDIALSSIVCVPFTTVREDTTLMGIEAVSILLKNISQKRRRNTVKLLDGELIVRKSVAAR